MRKICILILVSLIMVLSSCVYEVPSSESATPDDEYLMKLQYGDNYKSENTYADQEYLAGMCFLYYEKQNDFNYVEVLQAMKNLGVKSLRTWMHFSYLLLDPYTINEDAAAVMHEYIDTAIEMGFQIIGMNHYSYHEEGYFSIGKVERIHEDDPDSKYSRWLKNYELSWNTLVTEFSEVMYWEIDNELNNPDFMYINGEKENVMSFDEMVPIALDMLYFGSLGIHSANPDANTILGGLVDTLSIGKGTYINDVFLGFMTDFLEKMYDAIDSGEHYSIHYDDFFQIAAWHPYHYIWATNDEWVRENNKIYEIITRREGKEKKVFLSEFGWQDKNTDNRTGEWILGLFDNIRMHMPYVESIHYHLMFDYNGNGYGLYEEINHPNPILSLTPKSYAYDFQKATGGEGELVFTFKK